MTAASIEAVSFVYLREAVVKAPLLPVSIVTPSGLAPVQPGRSMSSGSKRLKAGSAFAAVAIAMSATAAKAKLLRMIIWSAPPLQYRHPVGDR